MAEFWSWTEANWQPLAAFFVQLAFLVAGVWFARNVLKTIRSFQEQVGALLKLTITAPLDDRQPGTTTGKASFAEGSPYWLTPSEPQTVLPPAAEADGPGGLVAAWRAVVLWMQAPMNTSGARRWHRVVTWLRAPVGASEAGRMNAGNDDTTTGPVEFPRPSMIELGIGDRSQTAGALDNSVNQALGGRLKSC